MDVLRRGSRGFQVELLQRLVNKALGRRHPRPTPLKVDGIFGPLTDAAVRAFQGGHRPLQVDGIAGRHTWHALGLRSEAEHANVRLTGQTTTTSCWSVAAGMIGWNQSVGPGAASLAGGGLVNTLENHEAFARSLGWQILDHTPSVQEMVSLIRRTPVWISGGGPNWAHAVVLSGVYSDGDLTGHGTMVRVHDPWPLGAGRVYGSFADPITMFDASGLNRVPAALGCVLFPR